MENQTLANRARQSRIEALQSISGQTTTRRPRSQQTPTDKIMGYIMGGTTERLMHRFDALVGLS